jgi:hypothetical protein
MVTGGPVKLSNTYVSVALKRKCDDILLYPAKFQILSSCEQKHLFWIQSWLFHLFFLYSTTLYMNKFDLGYKPKQHKQNEWYLLLNYPFRDVSSFMSNNTIFWNTKNTLLATVGETFIQKCVTVDCSRNMMDESKSHICVSCIFLTLCPLQNLIFTYMRTSVSTV